MSYHKKNKNISNVFLNKDNILVSLPDYVVIKYLNTDWGIWISKIFTYPARFDNQICVGIDITNNYQITNSKGNVQKLISGKKLVVEINEYKKLIKTRWKSENAKNLQAKEPLWNKDKDNNNNTLARL